MTKHLDTFQVSRFSGGHLSTYERIEKGLSAEDVAKFRDICRAVRKTALDESEHTRYFGGETSWKYGTMRPHKEPLEGTRELFIRTSEDDFWDVLVHFAKHYEEAGLIRINFREWQKPDPITPKTLDGKGWHIEFAREMDNKNPIQVPGKGGQPFTLYDRKFTALIWDSRSGRCHTEVNDPASYPLCAPFC